MNSRTFCLVLSALCTLGVAQTGCSLDASTEAIEEVGTLTMPLTATSTNGAVYRLRNATIKISGTATATVLSEDYLDQQSFDLELAAGNYLIKLNSGWTLEKVVDGVAEPVTAVLTSDNPAAFSISDQQLTFVNFHFRAGDDVIQLGNGRLIVGVIVDDGPLGSESDPVACMDGVDNDGDGYVDCQDFDCSMNFPDICAGEPEDHPLACMDGIDNDLDGYVDCQDFDCSMNFPDICGEIEEENHVAVCQDGLDNDLDGLPDCHDPECQAIGILCVGEEENDPMACQDGLDNDLDGYVDCQDFECRNLGGGICPTESENHPLVCMDGIDNDLDGFTDCQDFECRDIPGICPVEPENHPVVCMDGIDNDLDGFTDCQDFQCAPFVPMCN